MEDARKLTEEAACQRWIEPAFGNWLDVESGRERYVANTQLQPGEDAAKLPFPILCFLAEEDENVPYAASLRPLKWGQATNPQLKVVTVHDAPHSFVVAKDDDPLRYTDE